ncbi:Piso0_003689 [Millerozyma farinosa CBS 7064]|uniref:Piso0_003689 protein n=1 Tax=Pichia sorbitophila (strain ATCC MYA-4447 / BCRC 22081 / CBS 7064 / NBRC 10061 / NRRL Y-12695) TaxID=559304 RepID=G8Y6B8_PICSO|nr:Piso0_003689 [Millerozyma farinosa CBS 7064]CCE84148.1 Piso0_003689 [Millerozyma farinosa CBS 7064]
MFTHKKNQSEVNISPKSSNESIDISQGNDKEAKAHIGDIEPNDNYIDHKLERRICRKLDMIILPFTAIMYLFNALDKGNISNAKTDGLDKDLSISGSNWNIMLSIFYIPFVLFAFPLSLFIKRYNAANVVPVLMFGFGCVTLLVVSAFNFSSLMAARWFLGMFESAFLPGIIYYLSNFYRRTELARRIAIFYAASAIANAFSGLLSYGCFQIDSRLHGWQILLLIEGSCTICFAIVAFCVLPRSVETFKFFTEEERKCAIHRIITDSSDGTDTKFSFKDSIKVFAHPVTIAWMLVEVCIGVPLNSINNWFPQIIGALGKSTVETNLYTVAPNVWGAVSLVLLAFLSDHFKVRSAFICVGVIVTLIGFVVYGCIDIKANIGAAYFSCFLMTTGASVSSVLTSTWYTNNTPGSNRRAVISSVGVPLANAAGLISTNIFRPQDAPKYAPALGITAGFGGLAVVTIASITTFMVYDNNRRNKKQGVNLTFQDVPTCALSEGPNNPSYRWMY